MIRFKLVNKSSFDPQIKAIEANVETGIKDGVLRVLDLGIDIAKQVFRDKRAAEGKGPRGPRIGEHAAFVDSFKKSDIFGRKNDFRGFFYNSAPHANIIDTDGRNKPLSPIPYEIAKKILAKEGKLSKKTETYVDDNGKKRRRKVNEAFIVNRYRRKAAEKPQRPYNVMTATREQLKRQKAKRAMVEAIKRRLKK